MKMTMWSTKTMGFGKAVQKGKFKMTNATSRQKKDLK